MAKAKKKKYSASDKAILWEEISSMLFFSLPCFSVEE